MLNVCVLSLVLSLEEKMYMNAHAFFSKMTVAAPEESSDNPAFLSLTAQPNS